MKQFFGQRIDERKQSNARLAAAIWLGVTQVLLAGVIFFRLYVLGQPDEEIRDFQAVLAVLRLLPVVQAEVGFALMRGARIEGRDPREEIRDFQAVLAVSIFGYIALQLLMGGIFPVPSRKGLLFAYLGLAGLVTVISLLIHGLPPLADWQNTWLPALAGPAILVGLYWLGRPGAGQPTFDRPPAPGGR